VTAVHLSPDLDDVTSPGPDAPQSTPTPLPLHRQLGVTDGELVAIHDRLGRDPNDLELAIFSVMWSEHCSYKSSKPLLRTLPTRGEGVIAGPGEQAGVMSIGDGLAVAFKIESHNHPSAVEPYQGAATGVGGILRDIFAMGARPIAVLDALRFGDPSDPRTRHLVDGVVRGVGGYGNCVGVPTVGGELVFDPSYQANPLVNVMAIGLLEERLMMRASAPGPGNLAVLFGSATGRDGIGGASVLASATFSDSDPSKRPSVQVGDPFAEKLLIEASLELIERGLIVGLQDLGAGGISCATSECADRAGTGIAIDLDAVPRREPGMAPFEVMISESQERMLAIVEPPNFDAIAEVCARWGLPCAVIGRVTADGDIAIFEGGIDDAGRPRAGAREIARIPAAALTSDAIVHERIAAPPVRRRLAPAPGLPREPHGDLPERGMDPGSVLLALLGSANLADRRWVCDQYDSTVQTNTVAGPGRGAAVLRVKGTPRALVASVDGNQGISALDPWRGAAFSVAEAARNVAITGARPLGVTNCLNFGDPTRPEAFWQLKEAVRGLGDACRALGLPVTGGNVSLYNEAPTGAIAPTPQIGVVGLLDDASRVIGPAFVGGGDTVVVVGEATPGLGGSEYARLAGGGEDEPPAIDLAREAALQRFLHDAIRRELVVSAQDVAGGGLAVAIAECAIWSGIGAELRVHVAGSPAAELFGESPSRVVLTTRARHAPALLLLARQYGLPAADVGLTGGDRLFIDLAGDGATGAAEGRGSHVADAVEVPVADLRHAWEQGLPRALGESAGSAESAGEASLQAGGHPARLAGERQESAESAGAASLQAGGHPARLAGERQESAEGAGEASLQAGGHPAQLAGERQESADVAEGPA
jgi:phosphoribosylformylglycinamidine synthase subunit PurL